MIETTPNPHQKRNKIILISILVFVVLCIIVCVVAYFGLQRAVTDMVKLDPEQARNTIVQITDYNLPPGYKEMAGTNIFGILTTAISDDKNTIWLVQAPTDSLPTPEKFLQDAIAYQKDTPITWTAQDIKIYTIRAQKSSITIYQGVTKNNQKYRAWAGKFVGKGGPALIVVVGPQETWDESAAEAFIRSMR